MPITLRSGITVGTGPPAEPFAPVKSDPFTEGLDEETTMRLAAWSMAKSPSANGAKFAGDAQSKTPYSAHPTPSFAPSATKTTTPWGEPAGFGTTASPAVNVGATPPLAARDPNSLGLSSPPLMTASPLPVMPPSYYRRSGVPGAHDAKLSSRSELPPMAPLAATPTKVASIYGSPPVGADRHAHLAFSPSPDLRGSQKIPSFAQPTPAAAAPESRWSPADTTPHPVIYCDDPVPYVPVDDDYVEVSQAPIAPERLLLVTYDACVQVCVTEGLSGQEAARGFLDSRCAELQKALGLGRVLLHPAGAPPPFALPQTPQRQAPAEPSASTVKAAKKAASAPPPLQQPPQVLAAMVSVQVTGVTWQPSMKKRAALLVPLGLKKRLKKGGEDAQASAPVTSALVRLFSISDGSFCEPDWTEWDAPLCAPAALRATLGAQSFQAIEIEVVSAKGRRGTARIPVSEALSGSVLSSPLLAPGTTTECGDIQVVVTITSEQPKAVARVEQDCLTPQRRPAVPVAPAAVVDPSFTQERSANAAVTPAGVYDVVLEAALRAGRFGKRRLPLAPQWAWLLGKVAKCHGVAEPYCLLRYLQHVMSASTPSADCLQIVLSNLSPVLRCASARSFSQQEGRMLASVRDSVDRLLALSLENYKQLSEAAPSGVAEGPLPAGVPVPSPALFLTVEIFDLLHDPSGTDALRLLMQHLRVGANKCYWRSAAAAKETTTAAAASAGAAPDGTPVPLALPARRPRGAGGDRDDPSQDSFASLACLCAALSDELRVDQKVAAAGVLPPAVGLPSLAAEEYCRELGRKLSSFLDGAPPPKPAPPVLNLLDAIGDLQDNLDEWSLAGPQTAPVEPEALFGKHVRRWIADSRAELIRLGAAWGARGPKTGAEGAAAAQAMYGEVHAVLLEYERIASRWPVFTADLEGAIVDAERTMLKAIEGWVAGIMSSARPSNGAAPAPLRLPSLPLAEDPDTAPAAPEDTAEAEPPPAKGRMGWWLRTARAAVLTGLRRGPPQQLPATPPPVPPPQPRHIPHAELGETFGGVPAALAGALVALKTMETVRPEYHERLRQWAQGDARAAAEYGKLFLVIGQEIRGQYMACLRLAVERAASSLKAACNIRALLLSLPADADPSAAFSPMLSAVRKALAEIEAGCGRSRVLVGVSRGLWDKAAAEILAYLVEDCRENSSWRQRLAAGAAVEALGAEFAAQLHRALGHEIKDDDMRPPEHAKRVSALQSVNLSQSYSMY